MTDQTTETVNQQKQEIVTKQKNPLRIEQGKKFGSLSVFGLAISGYLLYSKLKKPEQNLIDVPPPPVAKTNT